VNGARRPRTTNVDGRRGAWFIALLRCAERCSVDEENVMQTRDTVVAVFDERDDAEDAIKALKSAGFREEDIGLVARNRDEAGVPARDDDTKAGEGAATGAVVGGLVGGLSGLLAGIGALSIPIIGPVVAAGAFASALVGVVAGAGIGAIAGALIGMGIPEEEANWYEERVRGGAWLVTVKAGGRYDEARRMLREYGGKDYEAGTAATATRSWDLAAPEFRSDYERQYGTGGTWGTSEPAHRFGYEAYGRGQDGDASRRWSEAEPALRRDWENQGSGTWDDNRIHIRHGYDYARGRTYFRE
jgi:uncharacterized membrane protein